MRTYLLLTFLACLAAPSLAWQNNMPGWLDERLHSLKADVKSALKTTQTLLAQIERLEHFIRNQMPSQLEHTRSPQPPARLYPESCAAYYKSGDTSGGQKMIDPMQNGSPLSVNCQYGGGKVITEFGFNSDWSQRFDGPMTCSNMPDLHVTGSVDMCSASKHTVPYQGSMQELRAAIQTSGSCSQRVRWSCHDNKLLYLMDYSGEMTVYGQPLERHDGSLTQGACECMNERSCDSNSYTCNCANAKPVYWKVDRITVSDNSKLPIMKVMMGDLARNRQRAQVAISSITCTDSMPI